MTEESVQKQETGGKNRYEVAYHAVPTLGDEAVSAEAASIRSIVERAGGTVVSERAPERFQLAYTIEKSDGGARQKFDESYFGSFVFEATAEAVPKIIAGLKLMKTLVRHIVTAAYAEGTTIAKPRPMFKRPAPGPKGLTKPETMPEPKETLSAEEMDKEIDKLVSSE